MLKSISTLAVCLGSLLCSAQQKAPAPLELKNDSLTIIGQYDHYNHQPKDEFVLTVFDWTSSYQKKYATPIDPSGKFSLTVPFPTAGELYLDWGRISEMTIGLPGETIRLYADLDDYKRPADFTDKSREEWFSRKTKTRFDGANAGFHTSVRLFKRELTRRTSREQSEWRNTITSDLVYRDSVMLKLKNDLRFLDEYAQNHPMEPRAKQYLAADLRCEATSGLSQYSYNLREQKKDAFSPDYMETLDSIRTLVQSAGYYSGDYMTMLRDLKSYAYTVASGVKSRNTDSVFQLLVTNPAEKEITYTWDVNRTLETSMPLEPSAIETFEGKVKNPFLRAAIMAKNNALLKLAQDDSMLKDTRLVTSMPEFTTAEEMLAHIAGQYKGKVIYMDIWGTWCAPCRDQMNYVPALKQRLKGKDVVFVYLANNSVEKAWKGAIKQHKLVGDNVVHYNLPREQQGILEKKYLYGGWPTYIIIDKEGKYVTNQAPRPSQPDEAVKAITDLL
ncbi:TlpA family protein disulfide reductase [Chitinophaga barathri]|nr:TlpA disulfide reductase family protein [Chitinophaga barathri]